MILNFFKNINQFKNIPFQEEKISNAIRKFIIRIWGHPQRTYAQRGRGRGTPKAHVDRFVLPETTNKTVACGWLTDMQID